MRKKPTNEKLPKVSSEWQKIIQAFNDPVLILDKDFRILNVNEATLLFFDKPEKEILGQTCYRLMHNTDTPPAICPTEKIKVTKRREEAELYLPDKDIWVHVTADPLFDTEGNIEIIIHMIRDITERLSAEQAGKQAEETLLNEKQKFLTLLENAPFGMIMISQNGTITYTNQKFREIFGYEPKDIPDGSTWFRKAYPDAAYRHEVISAWKDDLEEGRVGEQRPRVFTATCKDGSKKIVNFIPVLLATGDNLMACEDITERLSAEQAGKQAEEALKLSEEKYRSIFENVIEGIFQTTPEGRFLTVNPVLARIYGYGSPEEIIETVTDIGRQVYVKPNERNEFIRIMQEKGVITGFEVQLKRKDRSTFWASINARAVYDENGNVLYCEGTTEDITLRKKAEEKLTTTLESLHRAIGATIQVVVATVEARDPYTAGHQRRVTDLARAIAAELGLSSDRIEGIRMAGSMHDLGKISIPAEILSKPTKLTDIEFSFMKAHAQYGYEILKDVESPWSLAEIVLQHHERINGSGYPRGLKGNDILLEAHIIAVADVVESMASYRPYRPAKGIDAALEEIEKNKGILYDEQVVEVCLKLFREKQFSFE